MEDKLIIHLNRNFTNIETNKNNEVIYNLKEPLKLNPNDQVTLYKSFLDVRGQSQNTITLDRDYTETIKFGYYVPQSNICNAGLGGDEVKKFLGNRTKMMNQNPHHTTIFQKVGSYQDTYPLDFNYNPPTNAPAILGKNIAYISNDRAQGNWNQGNAEDNAKTGQLLFVTKTKTITIPAGNYEVEAIANLITQQMNGQTESDSDTTNLLFPKNKSFTQNETNIYSNDLSISVTDLKNDWLVCQTPGMCEAAESVWGVPEGDAPDPGNLNSWETFIDKVNNPTYDEGMMCVDLSTANRIKQDSIDYFNGNFVPNDLRANPCGLIYPQYDNFTTIDTLSGGYGGTPQYGKGRNEGLYNDGLGGTAEYDNCLIFSEFNNFDLQLSNDKVLTFKQLNDNPGPDNQSVDFRVALGTTNADFEASGLEDSAYFFEANADSLDTSDTTENGRILGTKSYSMDFGDDSVNRFQISNLHEPYRIPTYAQSNIDNILTTNDSSIVGNQATNFQLKNEVDLQGQDVSGCYYPQDASSGIYIISWSDQLRTNTDLYKELDQARTDLIETGSTGLIENGWKYITITNMMNMLLHDEAYNGNETKAAADWENTLWFRLGFSYKQFGQLSQNLESFYTFQNLYRNQEQIGDTAFRQERFPMMGLMTHNDANLSMATALDGLGASVIPDQQNLRYQTFGSLGTLGGVLSFPAQTETTPSFFNDQIHSPYENAYLLCSSKYLNADTLPDLTAGKNYFVIESDIVSTNYLDVYSNKNSVVGFISKENSEADTIFSTEGIPFTISQSRSLDSIKIRVLNPDGTDTSDEVVQKNSAFIFIVERQKKEIIAS